MRIEKEKKMQDDTFENEEKSNIYEKEYRDDLIENDEINSDEDGFMDGYQNSDENSNEDDII